MINVIDSGQINPVDWNALVKASPVATWFQTPEAYGFFNSLSFLEAFAVAVESDGRLRGVVVGYVQNNGGFLKRFLSRRAIVYGGPLLSEDITSVELEALLSALTTKLKHKAIYIETRNFNDYSRWRDAFEQNGFAYEPHYDVQVDTSSLESVNSRLDRNRRRNIKQAQANGVVLDGHPEGDDLDRFYAMLEELYKTKVRLPLFPKEFFVKLNELPSSRLFMAKSPTGEIVGALACVALEGHALYAWFACGDDRSHRNLSPSVMANYAGIQYAAEHSFPCFDFMGAGQPDDGGYGVRDFKLKFGGSLVEYGRYVLVANKLLFSVGKLAVKLMKRF